MIHHNATIKKPRSTTAFFSKPLQKHQTPAKLKVFYTAHAVGLTS